MRTVLAEGRATGRIDADSLRLRNARARVLWMALKIVIWPDQHLAARGSAAVVSCTHSHSFTPKQEG